MKLLTFAFAIFLSVAAWADPSKESEPELPLPTLQHLERQGWQRQDSSTPELSTWQRGESHLTWGKQPFTDLGEAWRLGQEQARLQVTEQDTRLVLARGWGFVIAPAEANSREELLSLAITLAPNSMVWRTFGHSAQGRPLDVAHLGTGPNRTLLFGVFHGDEPAGELVLQRLLEYLHKTPEALEGQSVTICPVVNPDGLKASTRVNARKVDINRNFPAKNWSGEDVGTRYWGGPEPASEPETQAVISLLESFRPHKIVTLHAPLHNVNYDGPAGELAKRMSAHNGYPVEPDIGYPTPGSFGNYIGRERKVPTITLEFPEGSGGAMWLENKSALLEAIRYVPKL